MLSVFSHCAGPPSCKIFLSDREPTAVTCCLCACHRRLRMVASTGPLNPSNSACLTLQFLPTLLQPLGLLTVRFLFAPVSTSLCLLEPHTISCPGSPNHVLSFLCLILSAFSFPSLLYFLSFLLYCSLIFPFKFPLHTPIHMPYYLGICGHHYIQLGELGARM